MCLISVQTTVSVFHNMLPVADAEQEFDTAGIQWNLSTYKGHVETIILVLIAEDSSIQSYFIRYSTNWDTEWCPWYRGFHISEICHTDVPV